MQDWKVELIAHDCYITVYFRVLSVLQNGVREVVEQQFYLFQSVRLRDCISLTDQFNQTQVKRICTFLSYRVRS